MRTLGSYAPRMPRYRDDSKDRVRDAVDFVALVEQRVPDLRKSSGANYMGRCPFHEERTASFSVNGQKKMYHCFGCGAEGDVFRYVEETEGLDFVGALEWLARRSGIELEVEDEDPAAAERRRHRERLLELLARTAAFYERYLWEAREAAGAREYLASRGLTEATLRTFGVGYAPSAWDTVLTARRRRATRRASCTRRGWSPAAAATARARLRPLPRPDHLPAGRRARPRARLRRPHDGRQPRARSTSTPPRTSCSTRAAWSTPPTSPGPPRPRPTR